MFILTLMLYCPSKSCKIQVAKEEKLVALATVLVAISSPETSVLVTYTVLYIRKAQNVHCVYSKKKRN